MNSISADLALNHGAVAHAILTAAGPQIQTQLNQQATGPANNGAIFITSGCNLKNKLVFHTVAPHWNQGQGSAQTVQYYLFYHFPSKVVFFVTLGCNSILMDSAVCSWKESWMDV